MEDTKKYIIVGTDLKFGGKIYPEGLEIDLTDEMAKALGNIIEPLKTTAPEGSGNEENVRASANEMIKRINESKTVEVVRELIKGEERTTVLQAAEKKIKTLEKDGGNN